MVVAESPIVRDDQTFVEILAILLGMVAGSTAGCAASMKSAITNKKIAIALVVAYGICGGFAGGMVVAGMMIFWPDLMDTYAEIVLWAGFVGFVSSAGLAGGRFVASVALKQFGLRGRFVVERIEDEPE